MVGAGGVDSVLVADDLPELGADLVSALTSLDVNDFSHEIFLVFEIFENIYYILDSGKSFYFI